MARMVAGRPDKTPLIQMTAGTKIDVQLAKKRPYELDGGGSALGAPPEDPDPAGRPPHLHADGQHRVTRQGQSPREQPAP